MNTIRFLLIERAVKWKAGAYNGVGRSTRWYSPDTKSLVMVLHADDSRWNVTLRKYQLN